MGIVSSFVNSLMLPKKKAVLKINKIKISTSVIYFALLMLVITLPDLLKLTSSYDTQFNDLPRSVFMFQIVIFYPFQSIFTGILGISLVAAAGLLMNKLTHRKIKYALLWKMSLHASTTPLILYALIRNFFFVNFVISLLLILLVLYFLYKMITVFPKPKKI
ncbi:DUF1189 family protein [Neobacillus dielmonensis]|uniref:DUF1189 family protein n=1 Tax=Neobacillus dielmonensis TaxID=1347369 RepID=UPI0005A9D7F4|nr:DUF1189 family protein [Neobacillus dielmonensis]